jgi:hypothetical protein
LLCVATGQRANLDGSLARRSSVSGRLRRLVTVVVLSAIVPTAIAQTGFAPDAKAERERDFAERALEGAIPAEEYV